MAARRIFEFHIAVHDKGPADVYFLEDRRGPSAINPDRRPRVALDLDRSDIAGLTPKQLLWTLSHALTDALEGDPEFDFFSS